MHTEQEGEWWKGMARKGGGKYLGPLSCKQTDQGLPEFQDSRM